MRQAREQHSAYFPRRNSRRADKGLESQRSRALLAALFGTSLAPIAGYYGWAWGVAAGFINSSVALNSGVLHGGMNLYNTGFSVGIVAAFLVPLMDSLAKRKRPKGARQE